jgi:hypothetical protein
MEDNKPEITLNSGIAPWLPVVFSHPSISDLSKPQPYLSDRYNPSDFFQTTHCSCQFPLKPISQIIDYDKADI